VDRNKLLANPQEIFQQKIEDGEVRLYESKDHTDNFLDCVYSGKPVVAPAEAAHRTISISHLGNIALRLGRTSMKWDPKAEKFVNDAEADGMLTREYRKPWKLA
jgi:hypothetical protein